MNSANYKLFVTKKALKEGRKLSITEDSKNSIKEELMFLQYWPDSKDQFDFETVNGLLKFNFDYVDGRHWIRVFVFQDDVRRIMWVLHVVEKKTNKLTTNDIHVVNTLYKEMIRLQKKYIKDLEKFEIKFAVIKGGK